MEHRASIPSIPSALSLLTEIEKSNVRNVRRKTYGEIRGMDLSLMADQKKVLRRLSQAPGLRKLSQISGEPPLSDADPMSAWEATFIWTNLLLNYGIFSAPFLFSENGFAATSMLVLAVAICYANALLLVDRLADAVDWGALRPGYGELAERAIGWRFSQVMTLTGPLECFAYGMGNCITIATTFAAAVPGVSGGGVILASCCLATVQCAIPDKIYAYVTFAKALFLVLTCALVLVAGMVLPTWADEWALVRNNGVLLPSCLSTVMFAVGAHCCVPMIFNGVGGDKEKCMAAIGRGYIVYFLVFLIFGFVGYYIYGNNVQVLATANVGFDIALEPNAESGLFLSPIYLLILATCQLPQVPLSRPLADLVNEVFGRRFLPGDGGQQAVVASIPVFIVMGLISYVLANSLASVESVVGGTLMNLNGFVFPGLVYMMFGATVGFKKVLAPFAVGLGIFLSLAVCWQSVGNLFKVNM